MRIDGVALPREFGECVEDPAAATLGFKYWLSPAERATQVYFVTLRDSKRARDKDINILHAFPSLGILDLGNTSITDSCVDDLIALRGLISLDITGTQISDAGASRLRHGLPNCDIRTDPNRRGIDDCN